MTGAGDAFEDGPTVDNPLCARDPELFAMCAEHRERCLRLLLNWHAARDLHEPHLLGDKPHYEFNEVKSCAQVFDVLARPIWTITDLQIAEGYFPYAWRGELFGDCAEEARHRISKAIEDGEREMARQRARAMPEPCFEH